MTTRKTTLPGSTRRAALGRGVAAGALVALAACGAPAGEAPKRARTAPYAVRFMALGTNPWMLEQLERFNREVGPALNLQVAPEPQPDQAALWTKFQSTLAAGDVPDLARLKEIWVFEAAAKGAMQPLDAYFKSDRDFNAADLLPLYQDNFKYKGQHYAVAREVSIIVGYYNKALFASAGLDPEALPTTYEQFRDQARRLTRAGPSAGESQWGFEPYEYGTREFILLWLFLHMRRFGAEFWNRDKTAVALNTPLHAEVMGFFVDLIHKDRSALPPGTGLASPWVTGRTTGKAAMWEQGTWDIPVYATRYPDLSFGVFLWPKKANQQHTALAGSSAIARASKDPEATWEFVTWWNRPENQLGWYHNAGGNGGNAPSRKSVYGQPPFSDSAVWKPLLTLITQGNSPPRPMAERYTELAESMTPALMKGFRGEVPAREVLDEASRAGTAFWQAIGGNAGKAL